MIRKPKIGEKLLCVPNSYRHASYDPTVGETYTCTGSDYPRMIDVVGPSPKNYPTMIRMRYRPICFISLPDEIDRKAGK